MKFIGHKSNRMTALGIDNVGKLVLPYGKEDTDYYVDGDPSSSYIYRAAESTFFCRLRDLFKPEMQKMFVQCESKGAWSASDLINQWDREQAEFPEELWRVNIEREYIRTYKQGATRFLTDMANGRKKYQRRQFERDQEMYIATKYFGTTATSDQIMMRFNNPVDAVVPQDFTLYITPYADMYIAVKYGNVNPINFRAKAGIEYTIPYGIEANTADITLIYGASSIQAIGDLSKCYVGDNDFSKASRLQKLVIGSDIEGYANNYLTQLKFGNNKLLEYLDIQNTPGLSSVIDLSTCQNMKELYAVGSGATGVIFANGGKIQTADLPAIGSAVMKNLGYLTDFSVASYENMHTLTVENCTTIDVLEILKRGENINRVRITGIDWDLPDYSLLERIYNMSGKDNNGYNVPQSVLSGKVHVPVIKEKLLENYCAAWSDLEISYDTMIEQYSVTFKNYDDTILDIQYVDKGEDAVDPITRKENPIPVPTKPSTVSTVYTYTKWDQSLTSVFGDRVIRPVYSESVREYMVKYVARGAVKQESKAPYGSYVVYDGEIPVYTGEEGAWAYYLFTGWDSSGFVTGDKTINAVYDKFNYKENYFDDKDISELRPVELYALTRLEKQKEGFRVSDYVEEQDSITVCMGEDYSYEDIKEKVLVDEPVTFAGSNYLDTKIKLLEEDRSWTLAIDYEWDQTSPAGSVLAQCYQSDGSNGFKLWNFDGAKLTWGTSSATANTSSRDILVLRHVKGETQLHVYLGNLPFTSVSYKELTARRATTASPTLVFGCTRADDGAYENYAKGRIYWSKLWYADLGEQACRNLAAWTHEKLSMQVAGFKRYYLSDDSGNRSAITFLASHLLSNQMQLNSISSTEGGWANFSLNRFLNSRFYSGFPVQWKQLIKQVKVSSTIGKLSHEISTSNCYVAVPSIVELSLSSEVQTVPYILEGSIISYMSSNESRLRRLPSGQVVSYYTRSPNVNENWADYLVWGIDNTGSPEGYITPSDTRGVLIEFSI